MFAPPCADSEAGPASLPLPPLSLQCNKPAGTCDLATTPNGTAFGSGLWPGPPSSTSSLTLGHEATLIASSQLMDAQLTHSFGKQWTSWSTRAHVACTNTSQCPITQPPRDSKAHSDCSTSAAQLRTLTPAVTTAQSMHRNREMIL